MVTRSYIITPLTPVTPSEVVAKLRELGYTGIRDFDVEYRIYEVEAISPLGEEVEIEIDPATGAILEIEEDFF